MIYPEQGMRAQAYLPEINSAKIDRLPVAG